MNLDPAPKSSLRRMKYVSKSPRILFVDGKWTALTSAWYVQPSPTIYCKYYDFFPALDRCLKKMLTNTQVLASIYHVMSRWLGLGVKRLHIPSFVMRLSFMEL